MSLLKRFFVFLLVFVSLFFISSYEVRAWGGDIHSYLCPGSYDCSIADNREFKVAYQWDNWGHLCLDNQPDCLARLGAKYFLKKYYLEGKKDWKLLAAAAHLYQDAFCPDHWYPMREYVGRIFVPFAPSWVSKVEFLVSKNLSYMPGPKGYNEGWKIPIKWKGQDLNLNKEYLDEVRASLKDFVSREPTEEIGILEKQIKVKQIMTLIRSYKEVAYLLLILIFVIWLYTFWVFKKKGKKSDLLITSVILAILVSYLLFVRIFW